MKKFLYVHEYANDIVDVRTDDVLWNVSRDALHQKIKEKNANIKLCCAHGICRIPQDGGTTFKRLVNFFYMHFMCIFKLLTIRPDYIFVRTSPPLIQIQYAILGKLFGAKVYVWLMDYHPVFGKVSTPKGSIKNLIWSFFDIIDKFALKSVDCVVCLDEAMSNLIKQRSPNMRTFVSPTFSLDKVDFIDMSKPIEPVNELSFIYSGNLGRAHNTDKLEIFLSKLSQRIKVKFAYCGRAEGAVDKLSALCKRTNVEFTSFPFVKKYKNLGTFYKANSFDYGVVILNDELSGVVSPSKFSGYTSFGLPILNIGPQGTNADIVCKKFGAGISVQEELQFDEAIEKILQPQTQNESAINTKKTIDYFSENAGIRLANFFESEIFDF